MTTTYTPGTQVDHYEIIRMLGYGGMNRVYLARDISNQQEVVLKFPNDDLIGNIAVFERYKREAEIGNLLHHPYVQHLLNSDEKRSQEYLVVEYIKGQTLRSVLEDHAPNPLPAAEAIRITSQIMAACFSAAPGLCISYSLLLDQPPPHTNLYNLHTNLSAYFSKLSKNPPPPAVMSTYNFHIVHSA